MSKYSKVLALILVGGLVLAALGLAGCKQPATTDQTDTPETQGIQSTDDLKSGDKVAVQSGTTGEVWAKENLAPKGVEVVPYDDILAAFAALQAGDVQGVINDIPISLDVAKDPARGIEVVQEIPTDEKYGFAFNKKNTALRDAVNWGLAEVIKNGEYESIYRKWFGAAPKSIPDVEGGTKPTGTIPTLNAGKIVVGSDTAYPPFENVENGETVGFDVDLVKAIGQQIGMDVEFKTYKFDALITALQSGTEFDMIASAMTSTGKTGAERAQSVDFSEPYINSNQSLTVQKPN